MCSSEETMECFKITRKIALIQYIMLTARHILVTSSTSFSSQGLDPVPFAQLVYSIGRSFIVSLASVSTGELFSGSHTSAI